MQFVLVREQQPMPKPFLACSIPIILACGLIVSCARPRASSSNPSPGAEPRPAPASAADQATRPWADSSARGPEAEVYRTWLRYLESKSGRYYIGAGKPSPYWLAAEQRQWPWYDLAGSYLPDSATPEVLSIQPTPDGEYRVVTHFRSDNENNPMRSRTVTMTVFALRSEDGWVFGNALPRLTCTWRRESVGPITYIMEPGYPFDRGRAERAVAFTDSLASAFGVPRLEPLTYYLTSDVDEVYRIMGLETDIKWGPVGGVAQPVNHQLFSGIPAVGEDYRHELAHMILRPLMGRTLYFVSEGVPTWVGGTTGMDFRTAAGGLATFLAQHPDVSLDSILTGRFPPAQFYPAAGVFVMMVFDQGGVDAVKALYDSGPLEDFRAAMERLFKRPWALIVADWRQRVLSFASDSGGPP